MYGSVSLLRAELEAARTLTTPCFCPTSYMAALSALLVWSKPHELLVTCMPTPASLARLTKPKARRPLPSEVFPFSPSVRVPAICTETILALDATPLMPRPSHEAPMMPAQCVPWPSVEKFE